jgi:phospholipid/cholesterol/gamma-HCH transport system permease protein
VLVQEEALGGLYSPTYAGAFMLARLGRWALFEALEFFEMSGLPYAALKGAWLERGRGRGLVRKSLANQVYFTAVEPLPIFLLIAVTCGFFAIVVSDSLMRPNGLAPHVPRVVAEAIIRELVPLLIALIMIGRSGTAISTELGYMRVNSEIDALNVSGINIDYFLVLPRIYGVTLATICLTVAMSTSALIGGFWLGELLSLVSVGLHLGQILRAVTAATIGYALFKAFMFGIIISTVNCFHGLQVGRAFTDIPRANVRASVQCYLSCLFLNAMVSLYALLAEI